MSVDPYAARLNRPVAGTDADRLRSVAVLIVEDRRDTRAGLKRELERYCGFVEVTSSTTTAAALYQRYDFDILIVDDAPPDHHGIAWIRTLRNQGVVTPIIVTADKADAAVAIAALRINVTDFLVRPVGVRQWLTSLHHCLDRRMTAAAPSAPHEPGPPGIAGMVGSGAAIDTIRELAQRVAPTNATVLITGETGTGKELLARALHQISGRPGAFVPVNCGSIPAELMESELFGHVKGAFTGATTSRKGLWTCASHGTVFLDEISELPIPMQSKLLRALEEKTIRPVGADTERATDVRVVAATNRDLSEMVDRGQFREDLYFRLNVVTITVPPLRKRLEDLTALASHFVHRLADELGVRPLALTPDDIARLRHHDWPGNVRELKNVIERALLLGGLSQEALGHQQVPQEDAEGIVEGGFPLDWTLEHVQVMHMKRVLDSVGGNKSAAARRLGVSRKTLERKFNH